MAGYFQPGEDVNYITLSAGGTDYETYGTIYHEYVHFLVNMNFGKSDVPAWFNEGLAEYYQTFTMEEDIRAKLGIPQGVHVDLLRQNKLIPLNSFFNTSNAALQGHGSGSRSVFYAQAWAIMHYLIANNKTEGLAKYLDISAKGMVDEAAFRDAFQMGYADLEKELRAYVGKETYAISIISFKYKMNVDADLVVTPMNDAESNAYLGDLLYHTNRPDDAETYLKTALAADPNSSMANASMGMVKVRQRKYPEAQAHLDKAIAKDQKNHIAYYHAARLISREAQDEFGYIRGFSKEKAARMRDLLKKAIEINPAFTESYEMLAFVGLVTNEGIDEAIELMVKALKYQPGNQRYALRIAELYLRQDKFSEASALAGRVAKTADEAEIKSRAEEILKQVRVGAEFAARNEEARKRFETAGASTGDRRPPRMLKREGGAPEMSPEEVKRRETEYEVRAINQELRKVGQDEVRVLGKLAKIECRAGKITYTVVSGAESFTLASKDFQGLHLSSYVVEASDAEIGCDARKAGTLQAVLTYRASSPSNSAVRGDLVSIEFVPGHFRFVDTAAAGPSPPPQAATVESAEGTFIGGETGPAPMPVQQSFEEQQRKAMIDHIKQSLRKPGPGEVRVLGFIERSECSNKGAFFYIKTPTQILKLNGGTDKARPELKGFTPDIENLQIGCGMKAVDIPVVVSYRDALDKKTKAHGDLLALEFVPKSFVLEP